MICPGSFVRLLPDKVTDWIWINARYDEFPKSEFEGQGLSWRTAIAASTVRKKIYLVLSIITIEIPKNIINRNKNLVYVDHPDQPQIPDQPRACKVFNDRNIYYMIMDTCKVCLLTNDGSIIWTDLLYCKKVKDTV